METTKYIRIPGWLATVLVILFGLSLFLLMYGNYQSGQRSWNLVISALLLSIPLALLYGTIGVLVIAGMQRSASGRIGVRLAKWIYWTPRIAGILIILFVAMFSLDVFSEGGDIWTMIGGFIIHSIPSILMTIILALAWRRPVIGFVAFLLAAVFFLRVLLGSDLGQAFGSLLLFSGPMAAIAMAFWANWKWKDQIQPGA